MANKYKVKKVYDMPALKAYAIYVADDVKGITGPMDPLTDDARPVMANMTLTEANSYAKMLNSGESLSNVRYRRDYYRNMMYPRNN